MELRDQGATVYQFEGGEPFMPTPDVVKEAMKRALDDNQTRYAPSSGIPELREAIADKLRNRNSIPAEAKDVIVVNGGMQGLFGAFQSIVNPGDEVLLFSPYWTPIKDLVAHCQGRSILVPTDEARELGFQQTLARYATDRTRAIYYNTPQNPSGVVFTPEEAKAVAAFVQERDLVVVADEAYEDLVYDGQHFSIASLEGMFERTITCFTFSKSYAMTGWRLGYAVATEPWMTGLKKATLYSSNGVSTPTQWAGVAALSIDTAVLADDHESVSPATRSAPRWSERDRIALRFSGRRLLRFSRREPHQQRQPRSCRGVAEPRASSDGARYRVWRTR